MQNQVITSIEQVTPAWLTAALSSNGALIQGQVTSIDLENGHGNWSESARMVVNYSADSKGERPRRLFLKMVDTDIADEKSDETFTDSEVRYYLEDYVDVPDAPLLRCYHGAYSEEMMRYHLLLEDVSETHTEAANKTPTLAYGLALAEGLATLHARWWGAERLAEAGAPVHGQDHIRRFVAIAEPGTGHIVKHLRDRLKRHWPQRMGELYARHVLTLVARRKNPIGFTLIHGDLNKNNILVPNQALKPLYFIDRQPFDWSLTTWLGVYDLAYALVLDWPVKLRRRHEKAILKHYHKQLQEHGIEDYPWDLLYDDYRLCLAMGVYIASEYCRSGINLSAPDRWFSMLEKSLTAIDDLDIRDLWLGPIRSYQSL